MELKIYWIIMLIGTVGEFAVPAVLGRFYRNYHPLRDGLGKLANPKSPVQWFYRAWLLLSGGIMITGGVGMWTMLKLWGLPLMILLILYGVFGRIGLAVLSVVDIYDVDWAPAVVYRIFRFSGFLFLQFAVLFLSAFLFATAPFFHIPRMFGALLLISAVMGILTYALSRMSRRKEFIGTVLELQGLWETLCLAFLYIPLGAWSVWLLTL